MGQRQSNTSVDSDRMSRSYHKFQYAILEHKSDEPKRTVIYEGGLDLTEIIILKNKSNCDNIFHPDGINMTPQQVLNAVQVYGWQLFEDRLKNPANGRDLWILEYEIKPYKTFRSGETYHSQRPQCFPKSGAPQAAPRAGPSARQSTHKKVIKSQPGRRVSFRRKAHKEAAPPRNIHEEIESEESEPRAGPSRRQATHTEDDLREVITEPQPRLGSSWPRPPHKEAAPTRNRHETRVSIEPEPRAGPSGRQATQTEVVPSTSIPKNSISSKATPRAGPSARQSAHEEVKPSEDINEAPPLPAAAEEELRECYENMRKEAAYSPSVPRNLISCGVCCGHLLGMNASVISDKSISLDDLPQIAGKKAEPSKTLSEVTGTAEDEPTAGPSRRQYAPSLPQMNIVGKKAEPSKTLSEVTGTAEEEPTAGPPRRQDAPSLPQMNITSPEAEPGAAPLCPPGELRMADSDISDENIKSHHLSQTAGEKVEPSKTIPPKIFISKVDEPTAGPSCGQDAHQEVAPSTSIPLDITCLEAEPRAAPLSSPESTKMDDSDLSDESTKL